MHECKCGKEFESGVKLGGHVPRCKIAKPENWKECPECGKELHVVNMKQHLQSHKGDKECLECGKNIENWDGIKKFCNSSCSASHSNRARKKERLKVPKKVVEHFEIDCLECGTTLHSNNKSIRQRKFCSNSCVGIYTKKKAREPFKDIDFWQTQSKVSRLMRDILIEEAEHKCCQCNWGEVNTHTGNVPLEIEHIDGDSENNKRENLTVLCPNCHSLTSTYKGANRGKGRHSRKMRYQEGKSY